MAFDGKHTEYRVPCAFEPYDFATNNISRLGYVSSSNNTMHVFPDFTAVSKNETLTTNYLSLPRATGSPLLLAYHPYRDLMFLVFVGRTNVIQVMSPTTGLHFHTIQNRNISRIDEMCADSGICVIVIDCKVFPNHNPSQVFYLSVFQITGALYSRTLLNYVMPNEVRASKNERLIFVLNIGTPTGVFVSNLRIKFLYSKAVFTGRK